MKIINALSKFFKKLFKQSIQEQLNIIVPIAKDVVLMIENDPSIIASKEKQAAALTRILIELAAKEIKFIPRLINLAIEIAVIDLKGIEE